MVHAAFPPDGEHSVHCTLMAVDVSGFGDPRRTCSDQEHLSDALHDMLDGAIAATGMPAGLLHIERHAEGALVVASAAVPTGLFVDDVAANLGVALRDHNRRHSELHKLRLRMAVHAGHVAFGRYAAVGPARILLYRLLESAGFRNAFDMSAGDLGVVVSDHVYEEVVRDGRGRIDPDDFVVMAAEHKETKATCWVNLGPRVAAGGFGTVHPVTPGVRGAVRTA
jgi:hypothetical protein